MSDVVTTSVTSAPSTAISLVQLFDSGTLPASPPHECPYVPGRVAQEHAFATEQLDAEAYHELMNAGFRRSGRVYYRPACPSCQACQPLRLPVDAFKPSRSQRRIARRNGDVSISVAPPDLTDEKLTVYQRYLVSQHPGSIQGASQEDLEDFLYRSPLTTLEVTYRDPHDTLLGVSILDVSSQSVSSVYHFFDPSAARRSMGVYSVLAEINLCRAWDVDHYYMGYWIDGAPTMDYKANYLPHELLIDGRWVRRNERQRGSCAGDHVRDKPGLSESPGRA